MQKQRIRIYLEKSIVIIMLVVALLVAFFKPAVSIGMVGLLILSLLRFFLFNREKVVERIQRIDKILVFTFLFFLLWLLLSVFWSEDISGSIRRLRRFSSFLLLPIIIGVNADLIKSNLNKIIQAAVISTTVAAIPSFWFFIFPDQIPIGDGYSFIFNELTEPRDYIKFGAYSPFLDRLYFGYLTGFALLGMLILWIKEKRLSPIHWCYLLLIPLFVILGARGAQLAFGVAAIIGFFYFFIEKKKTETISNKGNFRESLILGGTTLLVGILLVLVVRSPRYAQIQWEWSEYQQNPTDYETISQHTVILRLMSWSHNIKLILEKPLTGFGLGDYVSAMQNSYDESDLVIPVHTNQQFLFFGVVAGLPAFFAFTLFYLFSGWFAWKRMKSKFAKLAVLSIWMYMMIVMLFDSPLNYHMPSFLFLCIWIGFVFSGTDDSRTNS